MANNPTKYCLSEVQALWPNRPIGCIVSVGCGSEAASSEEEEAGAAEEKGLLWWLSTIRTNYLDDSAAQQETEMALQLYNPPGQPQPEYYRFSPSNCGQPGLAVDEQMVRTMREATTAYLDAPETSAQLREAAESLLALAYSRPKRAKRGAVMPREAVPAGQVRSGQVFPRSHVPALNC